VQAVSGLKAGEEVVTSGGLGVDDGTKVRIEKPGQPAGGGEKEEP